MTCRVIRTGVIAGPLTPVENKATTAKTVIVPAARARYLAEIADAVRAIHQQVGEQVKMTFAVASNYRPLNLLN